VPSTCISSLPDSAYVGQQLIFQSCTKAASSFYWLFGDGSHATTDSVAHTYTAPGIYHGSLATADGGSGNTKNFTIVVSRPLSIWTYQGMTDTASYALTAGGDTLETSSFSATNLSNISNIVFVFSALPTSSGSYQVINDQSAATPSATQVAVYLSTPGGRNYGSTGHDHVSAAVALIGGRVTVSIPAVEMVNQALPSDSISLSATLIQTE
jgi:PKD repeat protein